MAGPDDILRSAYGSPDEPSYTTADVRALIPPSPYEQVMQQARGLQSGMLEANPIEMAMGLLGPRVGARIPLSRRLEAIPQIPKRDLLPSDLPIDRSKSLDGHTEFWSVYSPGGRGGVNASIAPQTNALRIHESSLPDSQRGQGIGMAMYQRLIDQAHKQGYVVHSDNLVSPYAQPIYAALAERGYQVQRHPEAITHSAIPEALYVPKSSAPVFTVHPPRGMSPEIMEILRKYGIAAPVAAGVLQQAYGDQDQSN